MSVPYYFTLLFFIIIIFFKHLLPWPIIDYNKQTIFHNGRMVWLSLQIFTYFLLEETPLKTSVVKSWGILTCQMRENTLKSLFSSINELRPVEFINYKYIPVIPTCREELPLFVRTAPTAPPLSTLRACRSSVWH